jgi:hypothetical protein
MRMKLLRGIGCIIKWGRWCRGTSKKPLPRPVQNLFIGFARLARLKGPIFIKQNISNIKYTTMSKVLGKRKAREVEENATEVLDAQEIFRRHFEAQFKPLPVVAPVRAAPAVEEEDEDNLTDEEESEWDGISEEDGRATPIPQLHRVSLTPRR